MLALANQPGVTRLVAPPVQNPIFLDVSAGSHPASWSDGHYLALSGSGTARIPISVPTTGRYSVWLGGSIQASTALSIDGRKVGSVHDTLQENSQYMLFGDATLAAGAHGVTLTRRAGLLVPGSGVVNVVGPLILRPAAPDAPLLAVSAANARQLCGRNLDWIEGLSG